MLAEDVFDEYEILKVINTKIPNITPMVINPIPGNPKYRKG